MKRELAEFGECFNVEIKKQLDDLASKILQRIQDTTKQIDNAVKCLGEMEERMAEMEAWDIRIKYTLSVAL